MDGSVRKDRERVIIKVKQFKIEFHLSNYDFLCWKSSMTFSKLKIFNHPILSFYERMLYSVSTWKF